MENVRKHRDIKVVTTETRRNYLLLEQNYHTTKFFTENVLSIEMRKTQTLVNKSVHLCLSILDLSKTSIYEFWYQTLHKICENAGFHRPIFSRIRTESAILSLCGRGVS